jgi:hypothetical protein
VRLIAVALLLAALGPVEAGAQDDPYPPVPKAACTEGDQPEPGFQGEVTLPQRAAVFAGAWCNLRLVGQFTGEGASWQLASHESCAYYSQADKAVTIGSSEDANPRKPGLQNPGTPVLDVSDPAKPRATAYHDDPGTNDSWESIATNARRRLLASAEESGGGFAIYDIAQDCRRPRKLWAGDVEGVGHAGRFAPDGLTYWSGTTLRAIDVADPANPRTIEPEVLGAFTTHDLGISEDGTRAYLAVGGVAGANGLQILDVSDVQHRRPEPKVTVLGEIYWLDGANAQNALPVTIAGRPFLVFTDELGPGHASNNQASAAACAGSLPPYGFARLIDIADEQDPKVVSKLVLEVDQPENCPQVIGGTAPGASFGYDTHYCSVDDPRDARLLACSQFQSGLRVYDISDPARPHEVAYYNPPARPGYSPGSNYNLTGLMLPVNADWTPAHPQFRLERREIWFTSEQNGFQVVRFTPQVALPGRPAAPGARATIPRPSLRLRARRSGRTVRVTGRMRSAVTGACSGRVNLRFIARGRTVARRTVAVRRDCRFAATLRSRRVTAVRARFHGNRRLLGASENTVVKR